MTDKKLVLSYDDFHFFWGIASGRKLERWEKAERDVPLMKLDLPYIGVKEQDYVDIANEIHSKPGFNHSFSMGDTLQELMQRTLKDSKEGKGILNILPHNMYTLEKLEQIAQAGAIVDSEARPLGRLAETKEERKIYKAIKGAGKMYFDAFKLLMADANTYFIANQLALIPIDRVEPTPVNYTPAEMPQSFRRKPEVQ